MPGGPQPFALVVDGNVSLASPSIFGISPNKAVNDAPLNGAVISGSYLAGATEVKLTKGAATIAGAITANTETQVTANFPLAGAAPGVWDLAVTNPFGTALKSQAFNVLDSTLPDLRLALNPVGTPFGSAAPVTFTLQIENASLIPATGVVFTHTFPAEISSPVVTPTCSTFTLLASGYRCAVGSLGANATAVYTVTAQAAAGLRGLLATQATVGSSVPDRWPADNTDAFQFIVDQMDMFLPLALRNYPLTPGAPVLQSISNADEDGNYTLAWSAPEGNPVSGYDIEQNGSILAASWGSTSYAISGKAPGYYAYRVRAINNYGPGPWSGIQTALVNPLRNWNFESGNNGDWTWSSVLNAVPIGPPPSGYSAHSGAQITWLGGEDSNHNKDTYNWVQQSVTIPAGATQLTYWYWILATDNCNPAPDNLVVKFNASVIGSHKLCNGTNMSGWAQGTLAIGAYGGQTVTLQFLLTQDANYVSNFLLDDVEIK